MTSDSGYRRVKTRDVSREAYLCVAGEILAASAMIPRKAIARTRLPDSSGHDRIVCSSSAEVTSRRANPRFA